VTAGASQLTVNYPIQNQINQTVRAGAPTSITAKYNTAQTVNCTTKNRPIYNTA